MIKTDSWRLWRETIFDFSLEIKRERVKLYGCKSLWVISKLNINLFLTEKFFNIIKYLKLRLGQHIFDGREFKYCENGRKGER